MLDLFYCLAILSNKLDIKIAQSPKVECAISGTYAAEQLRNISA